MRPKVSKFLLTTALVFFTLFMFSVTASAAPSRAKKVLVTQPNGERFYATTYGDEFFHWTVTESGDVVAKANDGYWHFAQVSNNRIVAGPTKYSKNSTYRPMNAINKNQINSLLNQNLIQIPAAREKGSVLEKTLPDINLGSSEKMLVFAVSFNDVKIGGILGEDMDTELAEIRDMMFGHKLGTVYNYYDTISNGAFHFEKAVTPGNSNGKYDGVVPVTLNYNHPNPDGLEDDGYDPNYPTLRKSSVLTLQIVKNTIEAVDNDIDFSVYDTNHDGWVSTNELHVVFIVAGYEAAYGYETPTVWAHSWSLFNDSDGDFSAVVDGVHMCEVNEAEEPSDPEYGKDSGKYTMQGEVHSDHLATIGTLCHELGHDCGLPDEYDYNYASRGVGILSLMGEGNWASSPQFPYDGACPVQIDAFGKMMLNFVEPTVVREAEDVEVRSFDPYGSYNIIKVPTIDPKQYFLIENRQPTGFDAPLKDALKSCGVVIYHVDEYIYEKTGGHRMNNDIAHKAVDVEEADEGEIGYSLLDANISYYTTKYDLAYYVGHNNVFGDNSQPSTSLYNGAKSGVNISVNSKSAPSMEISVTPGLTDGLAIKSITPENNGVMSGTESIVVTFTNDIFPGFLRDAANPYGSRYQFSRIGVVLKNTNTIIACTKTIKGNQLIIKPNSPLKTGEYSVYIPKGSLKDKLGKLYKVDDPAYSSFVSKFFVEGPLSVIKSNPADKATDVSVDSIIRVTFSKAVKAEKYLSKITLVNSSGKAVAAEVILTDGNDYVDIIPEDNMASGTTYKVNIPVNAVSDLNGGKLAKAVSFSFTTMDIAAPRITGGTIAFNKTKVPTSSKLTLIFNEQVQLLPYCSIVLKDKDGNTVDCTIKITNNILTITPKTRLQRSSQYSLIIEDKSIADMSYNEFEGVTINFTTATR